MSNLINIHKIYRGDDIKIKDHIVLHQPTLAEVTENESEYYSVVCNICTTPNDIAWQLEELNIDYVEADEYEVFINLIAPSLDNGKTKLFFGEDFDFTKMTYEKNVVAGEVILKQHIIKTTEKTSLNNKNLFNNFKKNVPIKTEIEVEEYDIIFDRFAYKQITKYLREMNNLTKNDKKPMSRGARQYLIDESKEKYEEALKSSKKDDSTSNLFNLISTMVNCEGFKHDEESVYNLTMFQFTIAVKRISKKTNALLLLQSGYSGFGIDLSKLKNSNELDWMGDL